MAVKHKIGGNQFEFLKGIVKSPVNRNSFFLIYMIDNRSAFIDDLHIYVHAAELHNHHFLHSKNEHELFTYKIIM